MIQHFYTPTVKACAHMKRIIALSLCLFLLLSMTSCDSKEEASTLQVGFGREDITKHFVSDNASRKLVKSGADGWALK